MFTPESEFPQAPDVHYLNHAAVAPWPKRAAQAVTDFAAQNVLVGARDYPEWMRVEQRLRQRLKKLLNAPSVNDIALVKNTSEALSFVAFGLDWRAGDQVVISDQEFPSNRVVWQALARYGVEVVSVDISGPAPEQALIHACTPRTRVLSISSVQYASGLKLDTHQLGQACQRLGVLFCVDAIQQLGAQPFDVQQSQCAFAMADGHKWMLGPEGLGVFYCHANLRDQLKLNEYGWHMLEHMGDYTRTDWQPANSARRFECGSPNMLGTMALEASLSLLEEVGIDAVSQALDERIVLLAEQLKSLGADLHTSLEPARRSGILTFSLTGVDSQALYKSLMQKQVICAQRGAGLRFSPHFYTPLDSLEQSVAIINGLVKS